MSIIEKNVLALALALAIAAAAVSPLATADQSRSQGFIEDSHLDFLTRNFYWHHDGQSGGADQREWGQSFHLDYQSGYSQGLIGFGVDLSAYSVIKLDGEGSYPSNGLLVPDGEGTRGAAGSMGGAVKMRFSNTELRYGNNLRPYNPVFAPADSRLLPATATGLWMTSSPWDELNLEAGHFTAAKDFNSTNSSDDFHAAYAGVGTDTVDFIGGHYRLSENASISLYGSEFQDIWRQFYASTRYAHALGEGQSLDLDFNIYRTEDEGSALAGEIEVTAWSFAAGYTIDGHTFKLTHQRINGDQPFDYLGMGPGTFHDSIYLANSSHLADFNGPNERSWGLHYNLDMTSHGIPGLTFHARYIRGSDIDGSKMDPGSPYNYYGDNEDHWERDLAVGYVVQSGPAKDLSFLLRQATHRIGNGSSATSGDQVRLIVEFPYEFF